MFFQTPYLLSVAYQAGVVLIEPQVAPPAPLPVLTPRVVARPLPRVEIAAVEPRRLVPGPAARVTLRGTDLVAADTVVDVDGVEVQPEAGADPSTLLVTLPPTLRAGVRPLRVIRRLSLDGSPPRRLFASNVATVTVVPTVAGPTFGTSGAPPRREVTATVVPALGPDQKDFTLLLSRRTGPSFTLDLVRRVDDAHPVFSAQDVPPGTYVVRIRIEGAESQPEVDADPNSPSFGQVTGPTVTLP